MNTVMVHCPNCGRRLFDVVLIRSPNGVVRIRCPRCKSIGLLELAAYDDPRQERPRPAINPSTEFFRPLSHSPAPTERTSL